MALDQILVVGKHKSTINFETYTFVVLIRLLKQLKIIKAMQLKL